MAIQSQVYITTEEYLALERSGTEKHEYLAGSVYAMASASARHNRIAGSAYASLYAQLRQRNCTVYPSDMRVKAVQTGMYAYPDITIVCGNEQFEDDTQDSLLNPVIIIEVLSPSTEQFDRGRKFQSYRTMLSLREYTLISQDDCRIERFARQSDNTWVYSEAAGRDGVVELGAVQCVLRLAEVYEKVTFPQEGKEAKKTEQR